MKKFIKDISINTVASGIVVVTLQFIVLPLIARQMQDDEFGLLVSIIALVNILGATFGNVMNNVRIIYKDDYESTDFTKNINYLLYITGTLSILLISLMSILLFEYIKFIDILLISLISVLFLFARYHIVEFRIKLNFSRILYNNVALILGYFTGYFIFTLTGYWQFTYIFANVFSLIHIFILEKPNLQFDRTEIFGSVFHKYIILLLSGLLLSTTVYIDKLLIFPLLGGLAVSIYYTSSLIGKILNLIVSPVANVLLSYLRKKNVFILKQFIYLSLSSVIIGIISYFVLVFIADYVIYLLYPQFYDQAIVYVPVTTLTAMFVSISAFLNTFLLKYLHVSWQFKINSIYLALYLVISLILLHHYGLIGFVIGVMIASLVKLMLQIYIFISRHKSI